MNGTTIYRTSLRDFFQIIFKRKMWILCFLTGTVCAVGVGSFIITPTFEATSQLLIKIGRENLYLPAVPNRDSPAMSFGVDRDKYINSEIQILKSRKLAENVIIALGPSAAEKITPTNKIKFIGSIPRKASANNISIDKSVLDLQKSLDIRRIRKSNIIQVNFKHHDPQLAADTVNMLCEQYIERHLNVHRNPLSFRFFQAQSEVLEKKLKVTENKLQAFKAYHNITSIDEERSLLLANTNDLQADLNQTLSLKTETAKRVVHLKRQLKSIPETVLKGKEIDHNPYIISNLQNKLVDLELKRKDLLTKYTAASRFVRNIEDEIQILKETLMVQESKRFGKSIYGLNSHFERLQEDLFLNQTEYEALRAREQTQHSQIETYRARIDNMNNIETELARLQEQLGADRKNYRLYLSKYEESRIANAMDKEKIVSVSLVESAKPPIKPIFPRMPLNMFLAALIGIFGGLSIVFLAEYFDDSLENAEDLEQFLDVPVLGNVPKIEQKPKE